MFALPVISYKLRGVLEGEKRRGGGGGQGVGALRLQHSVCFLFPGQKTANTNSYFFLWVCNVANVACCVWVCVWCRQSFQSFFPLPLSFNLLNILQLVFSLHLKKSRLCSKQMKASAAAHNFFNKKFVTQIFTDIYIIHKVSRLFVVYDSVT